MLGYNTNVRHGGKLYHIQTEDSGLKHPHIITHLFADGGRIVASTKSSYAEHLSKDDVQDVVKRLMREQHKAMFISLRDGKFDEHPAADLDAKTIQDAASATIPDEANRKSSKTFERAAAPPAGLFGGTGQYKHAKPAGKAPSSPARKASSAPAAASLSGPPTSRPPVPNVAAAAAPTMTPAEVILSYPAEALAAASL